jgi:hypothetical protein
LTKGFRALYTECLNDGNHRGDGNTQNDTGLVYRVAENPPASGDPILQVRSSGEAVRFFVEHDGWTGSRDNSAWFGGGYDNYFAGKVGIGTTSLSAKLHVDGEIRGKIWYSQEYVWNQGDDAVKMGHSSRCVALLTYVRGKFSGGGERVHVSIGSDGCWYLGGTSKQSGVRAKARCVGMPEP